MARRKRAHVSSSSSSQGVVGANKADCVGILLKYGAKPNQQVVPRSPGGTDCRVALPTALHWRHPGHNPHVSNSGAGCHAAELANGGAALNRSGLLDCRTRPASQRCTSRCQSPTSPRSPTPNAEPVPVNLLHPPLPSADGPIGKKQGVASRV